MSARRAVFYVSDGTGITAEMLGRSLLTQFDGVAAVETTLPFVNSADKGRAAADQIRRAAQADGAKPLVFATFADENISAIVGAADCFYLDCFKKFIRPLEAELGARASHRVGGAHDAAGGYPRRIEALNFTMAHDDGAGVKRLADAEIILTGISRCGKTPTCLYLALHFGVFAANYPLIAEDLERDSLPAPIAPYRRKIFGLTIAAPRLAEIRAVRRPGSEYADPRTCAREIRRAEAIFQAAGIPVLDVTRRSIEELSAKILQEAGLARRIF